MKIFITHPPAILVSNAYVTIKTHLSLHLIYKIFFINMKPTTNASTSVNTSKSNLFHIVWSDFATLELEYANIMENEIETK